MIKTYGLSLALVLSLALAFLLPGPGKILWSWIFPLLFVIMLISSFSISFPELRGAFLDFRFMAMGILLIFVVSPLIAFLLSHLIEEPVIAVSLLITSVAPAGVANAGFSSWIKGKVEEILAITVVTNALSVFVLPFATYITLGRFFSIDVPSLFVKIAALIFIPLCISYVLQKRCADSRLFNSMKNEKLTLPPLFLIFWAVFSNSMEYLGTDLVALASVVFLINAAVYAAGYAIAGRIGRDPASAALSVGRRNVSLIYIIAFSLSQPMIALSAVIWAISQNLLASALIVKNKGT